MATKKQLEEQIERLTEALRVKEKVDGERRLELAAAVKERRAAQEQLDVFGALVGHYRAQRDTLLGFIEGSRDDRHKAMAQETPYGSYTPTTPLETFLERMRENK